MINLAKYVGHDVSVQLSTTTTLHFAMRGRPVPLMVKLENGKSNITTDPADASSMPMTTNIVVGRVVMRGDEPHLRIDDPVNQGETIDVHIAEEIILFVFVIGEKKSTIALVS